MSSKSVNCRDKLLRKQTQYLNYAAFKIFSTLIESDFKKY